MPRYSVSPPAAGAASSSITFGVVGDPASSSDRLFVGRLNEQGPIRRVFMDATSESVIAIFGKRGSGKSYTLGVILEGLAAPVGESTIATSSGRKAALLFDTLNVFWSLGNPLVTPEDQAQFPDEMARISAWGMQPPALDVAVWVPRGFRNAHTPSSYQDFGIAPSALSSDDLADLLEVDPQRDLIGQLLVEAREKTAKQFARFSLEDLLGVLETDEELAEYYAEATVRAARQRVRALAQLPLFEPDGGTGLATLLKPGALSVLELGEVPNSLRTVIASVVLRRIQAERSRAADAEKQLALNTRLDMSERANLKEFLATAIPPSWVFVDEAQNVLPAAREVKSSDAVVRFVREGRNFGLSFGLTTQQPSAVDQRILAQADTVICHKLTVAQDIARMRDNLKSAEPLEVKLGGGRLDLATWLRSLEPGTAIVTNTEYERAFAIEVRPRVTPHAGTGYRPAVD